MYLSIPLIDLWEAVPRKQRVRLLLEWNPPLEVDEIASHVYSSPPSDAEVRRVRSMLSELRSKGLVDSPERGLWTA